MPRKASGMKKRVAKNFVVEIRRRRGRKAKDATETLIMRAFERLQSQPSLTART
jgi:hypothetical protein